MSLEQKELEYWVATIPVIGPAKIRSLLNYFENENNIYNAKIDELLQVEGINQKIADYIINTKKEEKIKKGYKELINKKVTLITINDKQYPEKLRNIHKNPYGLFYRGNLPRENKVSIAIVGARNCSNYGKEMAYWFGRALSEAGIQIISGMAIGVDGYAHKGAINGKTNTFAVLGNGIDICYPRENFDLYMEIQQNGGIISEYGPGVPGRAFQFPMRNRIISGLSDGVLVVEAREKSGSLITADLALEQGKEVFAIPGRIEDKLSEGCLNLIKQGGEVVSKPEDILENFHINSIKEWNKLKKNNIFLDSAEKIVYASLSLVPKHVDDIIADTNLLISQVLSILLKMELDGFIKQTAPGYYVQSFCELMKS